MDYENISPEEAKLRMDSDPSAVVVDVRRPDEFVARHIPGAVNVPLDEIQDNDLPESMADKNTPYLIYCRSGVRSVTAAKLLAAQGYRRLANFGGILDWPYTVERGSV